MNTEILGHILSPLRYENIDGEKLRLIEAFRYHVGTPDSREIIIVPAGFECDGQSYPRLFWMIDNPQGKGAKAGFVHDYLYWLNGVAVPETGIEYKRHRADLVYYEALQVSGVPKWRAYIRYKALRLFGWIAWRAHTKRIKQNLENLKMT